MCRTITGTRQLHEALDVDKWLIGLKKLEGFTLLWHNLKCTFNNIMIYYSRLVVKIGNINNSSSTLNVFVYCIMITDLHCLYLYPYQQRNVTKFVEDNTITHTN